MTTEPYILDDPFHAAALTAFVEVARQQQGWPDSESVRRLAYRYYEEQLAKKNTPKAANTGPA